MFCGRGRAAYPLGMLLIAVILAALPPPKAAAEKPAAAAAAAASPAAPAAGAEVLLTDEAQLKELCRTLRDTGGDFEGDPAEVAQARRDAEAAREAAVARTYRVEVPGKGFTFGRYRAPESLIELDGDRPLRALDSALALDLDGTDDVAFSATPAQVSAWSKAKKAGTLKIVVTFRLDGERCGGSAAAQYFRLAGHSLSWQMVDGEQVVAAADEAGEPVGPPVHLAGRVEKVALENDEHPPADDGRGRLAGAQAALDKCATRATRAGVLVLTFAVQAGRVHEPQVILDGLRDEGVAQCAEKAIAGVLLSGAAGTSGRGTASLAIQ